MGQKQTKLLIVESPTKAKTISRFLDTSYKVVACMGHIRDLPESAKDIPEKYKDKPWKNLGVDVEKHFTPIYCIPKSKIKIVHSLKQQLKKSSELILATDEDREGESISWHLLEILKPNIPVKRIVFHEITKSAIQHALNNYRLIDKGLVRAQEARRVLDRLVGYTISPLLWKKISTRLSAGRVQSVAVKLISEREIERMDFVSASYCQVEAKLSLNKKSFMSSLYSWKGQKIAMGKDFDDRGKLKKSEQLLHLKSKETNLLLSTLKKTSWIVQNVEKKPISRKPKPPFITSTLQQAANTRLNLSPRDTMSFAQKLYEKGLITYMRTDSVSLATDAVTKIRNTITRYYGSSELPKNMRVYKTKAKIAQEAHEAIRPTGDFTHPDETALTGHELKLYRLIWNRTLACQMKNCEQEQTRLSIKAGDAVFVSSGLRIISPGFYKLYKDKQEIDILLPYVKKGDHLQMLKLSQKESQTNPPSRYNEASLIHKLETEGIGRPSTYAPIITTIQTRGYIKKKNKNLAPTFTALAVTALLSKHLSDYVDLAFSSKMEEDLDNIAEGKTDYVKYLHNIYKGKKGLKAKVEEREKNIDGLESRILHFAIFQDINFHVGRFGAYITKKKRGEELKSSLPEDLFLSDITMEKINSILKTEKTQKEFGIDPKTRKKIYIKTGRFGPYLEQEGEADSPVKRVSIPKFLSPQNLTLNQALQLLELPKVLGNHPKTKKEIKKSIGKYGPYVVCDGDFRSVPADEDFLSLDLKKALTILAKDKKSKTKKILKEFSHGKGPIKVIEGYYSPYIQMKNKNYRLPKHTDPLKLGLDDVLKIIERKENKNTSI